MRYHTYIVHGATIQGATLHGDIRSSHITTQFYLLFGEVFRHSIFELGTIDLVEGPFTTDTLWFLYR